MDGMEGTGRERKKGMGKSERTRELKQGSLLDGAQNKNLLADFQNLKCFRYQKTNLGFDT